MLGCRNYRGIHPIKKDCFFAERVVFKGILAWLFIMGMQNIKKDNGRETTSDPLYVRIDVSGNHSNL